MKSLKVLALWAAVLLALFSLSISAVRAQDQAADAGPLISPDEMLSVQQIRPGMKGVGRSVFTGTRIEDFPVTVLGVLRKIDFDGDLILVRIDGGYPVTSGSGVSSGMSGSPIYVDGKLIGALAFAWPFAKDPIAGVTPIAQMLDNYRPGSAPAPAMTKAGDLTPQGGPLKLDGHLFARATVVPDRGHALPASSGTLYLAPVGTPVMVSGMGRPGLEQLQRRFSRFSPMFVPGPGKLDLPPAERPKIEPGAAVGVQLVSGDVDMTAIGTVTYVKGRHVLAFGHPMFGLGSLDMPMTTAYIHGIIPSQQVSFKLGSPVETVGNITQDRNWSIGGALGSPSRTIAAEFRISDVDRGVRRQYQIQAAIHRDMTPSLLYSSLMNAINAVSPATTGTTRGVVEVWPRGLEPIRRENVFALGEQRSALEQLFGDPFAGMPMAELLQILNLLENNSFGAVPVDKIRVSVDLSEKRQTARIERAYAERKRVKPGETVKIGVVLQPANAPKVTREFDVQIPRHIPAGKLQIGVAGGTSADRVRQLMQVSRAPAKTLPQLLQQVTSREQNNDLTIEVAQPMIGISVAGREFPSLPNVVVEVLTGANPTGIRLIRSHQHVRAHTEWVVSGAQLLTLDVDADEKDKTGSTVSFGGGGLNFGSLLDLFRFGLTGGDDLGGGDSLDLEGGTDEAALVRLRRLVAALVAQQPDQGKNAPNDAELPSFDELKQLLEQAGAQVNEAAPDAGPVTNDGGLVRGPGVWRLNSAAAFQGGKLDGVLISSRGEVALAPQAKSLLASPDRLFWAQAADGFGNLYVGGWLDGSVEKISPDGKTTRLFSNDEEIAISALTATSDGTVYAAAEPSGTIYRIDRQGNAKPLCRLPGERVWVMRKLSEDLYVGTGSEGRLYRISPEGEAKLLFTAPDRHIMALTAGADGAMYCGTYPRGKVFRVRDERAEPVYEHPELTITTLATDTQGNLYAGTSPKATVVKITPTGEATTVFTAKERHVFSILVDRDGQLTVATGAPGRLYRVAPDRTVSTLWEPQASYVLSLSQGADGGMYATTAGPTQVVALRERVLGQGAYTTRVFDAGNIARWGALRWHGEGVIHVQTRSGNTAYPDSTWSDWSTPHRLATGEAVQSPTARYLQCRVSLQSEDGRPVVLRHLELFYRPRNRAPEVKLSGFASNAVVSGNTAIRWQGKDPDGDRLSYEVLYAPLGSERWTPVGRRAGLDLGGHPAPEAAIVSATGGQSRSGSNTPVPSLTTLQAPPKPSRKPAISRPVIAARQPVASQNPTPQTDLSDSGTGLEAGLVAALAEANNEPEPDLEGAGTQVTWNTRQVPDGHYRVKVVVSDADTSPDEPRTAEVVSEPILVDNTAPRILATLARRIGSEPPVLVPVKDDGTYVASAEYRVGPGAWIAAAAEDGIFDSREENLRINLERLPLGRQTLEIRVRDAAGNVSTASVPYFKRGTQTRPSTR